MQTQYSIVIMRPIEQVFAYITDVANDLHWQPEISEVKVTSPLPIGVGTTFIEVRRTLGRQFTWNMLVTDFFPNQRICIESVGGTIPYSGCRVFESLSQGTRVTETSEVVLSLWLRPFSGFIAQMSTRSVAEAYQRLKRILEAQP